MPAWATVQTVILSIPGMNCAACPITVKAALQQVDGVIEVDVRYSDREAVVTFDNIQIIPAELIEATTNAGYPSTLVFLEGDNE
ncbi:MAG: mercury resistance system periplasmic binding protein MerP [Methylophaga sp.]|nr:mercury resistance system periplasmic binding protein MerP [Methylophaga sp.]